MIFIINIMTQHMKASNTEAPNPVEAKPQTTSSSKKKYEFVWRAVLLTILALVSVVMSKLYVFQTHQYFKDVRLGSIYDFLVFSLPFAAVFTAFDWAVHKIFDRLCEEYYINWQKYPREEDRKKRCYTLVKWGYSIIYYLFSSIWAYSILTKTVYLPSWMGGRGDETTSFISRITLTDAILEMKVFYLLQFGKHFSRFFGHVFIRPQGNFFQYALHHSLSVFLIAFSYLSNYWEVGLMVLLLHDYSDFALIMARLYRDYRKMSKKVLDAIYVHAFVSWVGCRIVMFIYANIYPSLKMIWEGLPNLRQGFQREIMLYPYYLMAFMIVMLEVLHLFWTYYIAESFISVKVSNKVRHSYD